MLTGGNKIFILLGTLLLNICGVYDATYWYIQSAVEYILLINYFYSAHIVVRNTFFAKDTIDVYVLRNGVFVYRLYLGRNFQINAKLNH